MKIKTSTIFKPIDRLSKADAEAYELYETLSLTKDELNEVRESDLSHFIKEMDKLFEKINSSWQVAKDEIKKAIKAEHRK